MAQQPQAFLNNAEVYRLVREQQLAALPITVVNGRVIKVGAYPTLPEVRAACADIDLVLPSLDAGDEETFQRVNRPHEDLTLAGLVDGLARLRREHSGRTWLEVFIVDGVNMTVPAS